MNPDAEHRARPRFLDIAPLTLLAMLVLSTGPVSAASCSEIVAQSTWGVKHEVGADAYWLMGRAPWAAKPSGDGVRVAIVGSGIDPTHPDLRGKLACAWCFRDLVDHRPGAYDDNGHGTSLAATVAGAGHVQPNPFRYYWMTGARGLAPHADLIVAKAVDGNGSVTDTRMADAIRWAMDPNGDGDPSEAAQVILLSTGFEAGAGARAEETSAAVREAIQQGIVVVVPAGTSGRNTPDTPGEVPGVVSVGAVDKEGRIIDPSNRGPDVDVFAPGALVSAVPVALDTTDFATDGYSGTCGASMAAATVAGSVALLLDATGEVHAPSAGPERVAYVEALLRATGAPTADGEGRVLDVDELLSVSDRGTTALYPPFFLIVALVLTVLGRVGYTITTRIMAVRNAPDGSDEMQPPR